VAAANLSLLCGEMFNAFREDQDLAAIYIGLCGGLA